MRTGGEDVIRAAVVNAMPAEEEAKGGSRDRQLAHKLLNDSGNSERFRARHGRNS